MWSGYQTIAEGVENPYGRERLSAGVKIELREGREGAELSICGVVGTKRQLNRGDCETGGQCIDAIAELPANKLVNGWGAEGLAQLVTYWRRWHLNGMNAACEHQRARGETWTHNPLAECPDCGYKLGTAWLYEPLPDEVIAWARSLTERNAA